MPAFAVQTVRLTDTLSVDVGVEITCPALKDPAFTRGVITGAWIGEVFPSWSIYGQYVPFIRIEYGPFSEDRRLDAQGRVI